VYILLPEVAYSSAVVNFPFEL